MQETAFAMVFEGMNMEGLEAFHSLLFLHQWFYKRWYEVANYCGNLLA